MEPLFTRVEFPESKVKMSYHTKALFMGSCFSDYIGKIMVDLKFPVLLNPFGTLFNPQSIAENITMLISGKSFSESDLHLHDGLWLSLSHYTGFSDPDRDTCLNNINQSMHKAHIWLKEADFLVLTLGSSWAYVYNKTGKVVANCHKMPATQFTKKFLEPGPIVSLYNKVLKQLKEFNPRLHVVFTVSPVRHWAHGAVNNQVSKSVLHYSISKILQRNAHASYFPSYEIFMDELRDYRFYASDMLHPSEQATRYVWERFCNSLVDARSAEILAEVTTLLKAVGHRPVNAGSVTHRKFKMNTLKKIELLTGEYPFLDFKKEIESLS